MAELKPSSEAGDLFPGMDPQVSYSFSECKEIGEGFLEGFKKSVRAPIMLKIERQ